MTILRGKAWKIASSGAKEQVLLEQLYMETPEDGSHEAYCTKSHPCRLGEGHLVGKMRPCLGLTG